MNSVLVLITTVENIRNSVVVEEPSANVDVVTMDENGNTESAESIGDANSECTVRDTCNQQQ